MSQIKIDIVRQGTPSKRVISCALFKMKHTYRDFSKYERHFVKFLDQTKKFQDFEIRVYVDDTTKQKCLELSKDISNVSIYHFDCPMFREDEGHSGTFGTLVRFLPLFEKDLDIVWISDIDVPDSYLHKDFVDGLIHTKAAAFIHSYACYSRKPWANVEYPILGGSFLSRTMFPKQLLTRFLNNVKQGEYDSMIHKINEYNLNKPAEDMFPYGMDEYFMNTEVYNSIARQKLTCLVYVDYSFDNILRRGASDLSEHESKMLVEYYARPSPALFKKVKEIFDTHGPSMITRYPCILDYFKHRAEFTTDFIKIFKTALVSH